MTLRSLHLASNLSLPLEAVTQKLAWLGVTGSGKTYGASKLAELFWHAGAQFIVIDPVGVWYGLRLAKDGKKPSAINIPIFGGLHGDVPLESTGGELMANLVVDKALSVILDVSQFESDADKARFAKAFADRFFFRKKSQASAVHLFIEECQEFVPQNPQRGEEQMLHAFIRMQKLGRNFGIGSSYISQRPQEVNKKALNMAQTLFVFRTTGTHERTAIEKWIEDKSLDESIANDLPKIQTGHCHVWSPEFLKISETAHVLEKETFNASATPEVGAVAKARELAPIDLDKVRTEMAATIEKAKADDPRELRKQIAELRKQLGSKVDAAPPPKPTRVEIPVLKDAQINRLEKIYERMLEKADAYGQAQALLWQQQSDEAKALLDVLRVVANVPKPPAATVHHINTPTTNAAPRNSQTRRVDRALPPSTRSTPARLVSEGDVSLGKGERIVLTAVAQYPDGASREQLTVLTGYARSSRDTYLQRLSQAGFIHSNGGGTLRATDAGVTALGDFEPLPTGDDLRAYWMRELPEGERRVLEVLVKAYPRPVERSSIDEATGYARSSRDTYLQRLGARKLVMSTRDGVIASQELFS